MYSKTLYYATVCVCITEGVTTQIIINPEHSVFDTCLLPLTLAKSSCKHHIGKQSLV